MAARLFHGRNFSKHFKHPGEVFSTYIKRPREVMKVFRGGVRPTRQQWVEPERWQQAVKPRGDLLVASYRSSTPESRRPVVARDGLEAEDDQARLLARLAGKHVAGKLAKPPEVITGRRGPLGQGPGRLGGGPPVSAPRRPAGAHNELGGPGDGLG